MRPIASIYGPARSTRPSESLSRAWELAYTADGSEVVFQGVSGKPEKSTLALVDAATGKRLWVPREVEHRTGFLSPGAEFVLSRPADESRKLDVLRLSDGKRLHTLEHEYDTWVNPHAFSADGKSVLLAGPPPGPDKWLWGAAVWDLTTGKKTRELFDVAGRIKRFTDGGPK